MAATMKVIVIVTIQFTDSTGHVDAGIESFVRELDMPGSPAGLTSIILKADTLPINCIITSIAWSEPVGAFVLQATAKEDRYYRTLIALDESWRPWPQQSGQAD